MSAKFKKLSITLSKTPKSKPILSIKSPTSCKSMPLSTNSFKSVCLETIIKELISLKKEKQKTLEQRKIEEKKIYTKFFSLEKPAISKEKLSEIKEKYKEKKHGLKQIIKEQYIQMEKKHKILYDENRKLLGKLLCLKSLEFIKNIGEKEIKHNLSKEISEEISKINLSTESILKFNEKITKVLSAEELVPFYPDIITALCSKIIETYSKQQKTLQETEKLTQHRKALEKI